MPATRAGSIYKTMRITGQMSTNHSGDEGRDGAETEARTGEINSGRSRQTQRACGCRLRGSSHGSWYDTPCPCPSAAVRARRQGRDAAAALVGSLGGGRLRTSIPRSCGEQTMMVTGARNSTACGSVGGSWERLAALRCAAQPFVVSVAGGSRSTLMRAPTWTMSFGSKSRRLTRWSSWLN